MEEKSNIKLDFSSEILSTKKQPDAKLVLFNEFGSLKRKETMEEPNASGTGDRKTTRLKTEGMKHYTDLEKEEDKRRGISAALALYSDPWKVKKKLTKSDLNNLSRFLLRKAQVEEHIFVSMSEDMVDAVKNGEGIRVNMRDLDTDSEHTTVFKQWHKSSNSYVINGDWRKDFVRRRVLKAGDEVGLFWDRYDAKFYFSVLARV